MPLARTSPARKPRRSPRAVNARSTPRMVRARRSSCGTSCAAIDTTSGTDLARVPMSASTRSCVSTRAAFSSHTTVATMRTPMQAP